MIQTRLIPLPHGITLSCRMAGDPGRPVLMFLHGFPEAAFVWDGLLEHFAKPENGGYYCIAPNMRGFEQSSAPADPAAYRAKHLVQDISALIAQTCTAHKSQLEGLIAHDWGGAVAWNIAATLPQLMKKLVIINSPHPGTFLRELQHSPSQQAASAYMNFLIRPDAEALLAEDDFQRLWPFLTNGSDHPPAWLTEAVKDQYRTVWRAGLTGGCNLYRASPLRPPRPGPPHHDPAAAAVTLPPEMLTVLLPTLVLWAMDDIALPPGLLDGLEDYVPQMQLQGVAGASHWIVHEQPDYVASSIQGFLGQA
ncbi:alpha/beta fold hydrolase [Polaromonas sp. SM01]|uniref:alpha/beta fold hydrolase n=1 Tax=Polaromonas sp. SM01 TaxID=3085630 RepID=UPI00298174B7|nr:alpha/beta fold hydrolase [Polaromonas sp. SM01]MDW5444090.1 alpha/beta fold hydrolase [Polaromonas sp. SM01]